MENEHLLHMNIGSYYDREIEIISWSDQYKILVGKYCSIGRGTSFFYMQTIGQIGLQRPLNYGGLLHQKLLKCIWI